MFVDLQVYPDFEKPFIYYTETFYRAEGNKLINEVLFIYFFSLYFFIS